MVERKPSSSVLGVSTVFLETECAIDTHEDINAMVVCLILDRCYNSGEHGDSLWTSNAELTGCRSA